MQLSLKGLVQLFLTDIVAYRTALHDLPLFSFSFFSLLHSSSILHIQVVVFVSK